MFESLENLSHNICENAVLKERFFLQVFTLSTSKTLVLIRKIENIFCLWINLMYHSIKESLKSNIQQLSLVNAFYLFFDNCCLFVQSRCGSVWIFFDRFRSLRFVVDLLWVVVCRCGSLWIIVDIFWIIVDCRGLLWTVPLWVDLGFCGLLWVVLFLVTFLIDAFCKTVELCNKRSDSFCNKLLSYFVMISVTSFNKML